MTRFGRRRLIQGLAAAPILGGLHLAHAQEAPRRVVFLISRNGVWDQNFFPSLDSSTPTSDGLGVQGALGSSPILGSAFDALRSKMAIVRGLDGMYSQNGHNVCAPLCASTTPGSVYEAPPFPYSGDSILADSGADLYGGATPLHRVLRLSTADSPRTYSNSWSWTVQGGEALQLPVLSYEAAFASLVSSFPTGMEPPPGPAPEPTPSYLERALDRAESRYMALSREGRLSAVQRERLEAHVVNLRASVMRRPPELPMGSSCSMQSEVSIDNALMRSQSILSLSVAALACDLTRTITVDMAAASDIGSTDDSWHENSHYPDVEERGPAGLLSYSAWTGLRVAEFLTALDATPDVDGRSLLDNTLVVWTNELGWGNLHDYVSVPVCLAGAIDQVSGGTHFDYQQGTDMTDGLSPKRYGVPYNYLFNTLFDSFGVPAAAADPMGVGAFGQWDDPTGRYARYLGMRRQTLSIL